jgi:hypothetical protein
VERRFTPKDIIEGQLPVEEPLQHAQARAENLLHRITHSQLVFEARKHIRRQTSNPSGNGR